jgi:murein DD-endopeptidase MepM/ murein hydrolase activator NlpD
VWVFSPSLERYCYYAHLGEIHVKLGDLLAAGERIGFLGRTGKNAFKKRSPTHLHFMCLSFDGGRMTPHDTYRELLTAERR